MPCSSADSALLTVYLSQYGVDPYVLYYLRCWASSIENSAQTCKTMVEQAKTKVIEVQTMVKDKKSEADILIKLKELEDLLGSQKDTGYQTSSLREAVAYYAAQDATYIPRYELLPHLHGHAEPIQRVRTAVQNHTDPIPKGPVLLDMAHAADQMDGAERDSATAVLGSMLRQMRSLL